MNNRIIQISIKAIFIIGLLAVLKFYLKTSDLALITLILLGLIAVAIKIFFVGFVHLPNWLYRMRFTVTGIGSGIFVGVLFFTTEAIEKDTFIIVDLFKFILIGATLGGLLNNSMIFSKSNRLKRGKGTFLLERQLVTDFAKIILSNGERITGKLILTTNKLLFLRQNNEEKIFEKDIIEIAPVINTYSFLKIPNGFSTGNDQVVLEVQFPYYWLKTIKKSKKKIALQNVTNANN